MQLLRDQLEHLLDLHGAVVAEVLHVAGREVPEPVVAHQPHPCPGVTV